MKESEIKYWLALQKISEIGPARFKKIKNYFPNLFDFWQANFSEIIKAGIDQKTAESVIYKRKLINPEMEWEDVIKHQISVITIEDPNYPALLKEIYQPPFLLQVLGRLDLKKDFPLAIVGSRKITSYGRQVTNQLATQLAQNGLTIISGLALGVDACAHEAAVQAGVKTIGVLGCGLDKIYPAANRELAQKIIESGGGIISEFPIGTQPFKSNFPRRNRIISGLSLGALITEAGIKSGALITARYALEQNREVFAVPGNIYNSLCAGPNNLIKQGAKTVTEAQDVLETLNLTEAVNYSSAQLILPANKTEELIINILNNQPTAVDKIVRLSMLNISVVNSTLAIMEIKGLVKNLGGQTYIKSR